MKKYRMKPELFIAADKGIRAMNDTINLAFREAKQNKEEAKRQLKQVRERAFLVSFTCRYMCMCVWMQY